MEGLGLRELFQKLVLAAGGDVEEAMEWMRRLQEQGYLDNDLDLDAFFDSVEDEQLVGRDGDGRLVLTTSGEQHLRSRRLHRHGAAVHGRELGQRVGLALPGVRLVTSAAAYRLS